MPEMEPPHKAPDVKAQACSYVYTNGLQEWPCRFRATAVTLSAAVEAIMEHEAHAHPIKDTVQ